MTKLSLDLSSPPLGSNCRLLITLDPCPHLFDISSQWSSSRAAFPVPWTDPIPLQYLIPSVISPYWTGARIEHQHTRTRRVGPYTTNGPMLRPKASSWSEFISPPLSLENTSANVSKFHHHWRSSFFLGNPRLLATCLSLLTTFPVSHSPSRLSMSPPIFDHIGQHGSLHPGIPMSSYNLI